MKDEFFETSCSWCGRFIGYDRVLVGEYCSLDCRDTASYAHFAQIPEEDRRKFYEITKKQDIDRWNTRRKVEKFLDEIEKICKNHNMSIAHEDSHGAFIVENYDEENIKWLQSASICLKSV